jgi:hypothetical protein
MFLGKRNKHETFKNVRKHICVLCMGVRIMKLVFVRLSNMPDQHISKDIMQGYSELAEQPIKSLEKHYPPPGYMLIHLV